jgi:hypothetical protein
MAEAPGGEKPQAQSDWLKFEVLQATPKQHEDWIRNLLANPPEDPGRLAGDFLPSLFAAAPDTRALSVFVKYLYSNDPMVSGIAASGLECFPRDVVLRAVAESIEEHGPSEELAYFATFHTGWTHEDESAIVQAVLRYLQPTDSRLPSSQQPHAPTQAPAAIKLLRFILYVPNHAWPDDPKLAEYADARVLQAAPQLIESSNARTVQELSEYLGSIQPNPRAHELLLEIAERPDAAGAQARICLTWHR